MQADTSLANKSGHLDLLTTGPPFTICMIRANNLSDPFVQHPEMFGRFCAAISHARLPPCTTLFLRTGFKRALLTSNAPNRIEPTGFDGKKERLWPPVLLL